MVSSIIDAGTGQSTLTAAHLPHIGTDPSDTNKQFGYTCDDCHVQTASSNSVISSPSNHVNTSRDVAVSIANGGDGTARHGADHEGLDD